MSTKIRWLVPIVPAILLVLSLIFFDGMRDSVSALTVFLLSFCMTLAGLIWVDPAGLR